MSEVKGYKVFNSDWTCRGKQYKCPGTFYENGKLELCRSGIHFCKKASDCFNYYNFDSENHVAEVIAKGDIVDGGDKCCTNWIEVIREIPWGELLTIVNEGTDCTGFCNTGNWNTGNWNTGKWNTGDWNKSSFNTGCFNTGEEKIKMFNKPSYLTYREWINSKARYLLNQIPKNVVEWVRPENMTDEEKSEYPTHETTGGYLKVLDENDRTTLWWNSLTSEEKKTIMSIPNFDAEIFRECTGIDVEG